MKLECKTLCALSCFLFFILHSSFCLSSDWPQFQCNAARTGWTPDSPAPPLEPVYFLDFSPEPLGLVQPIIFQDRMYVPTLEGRLYAINPATGERLWVKDGFGPIPRTPSAADLTANTIGSLLGAGCYSALSRKCPQLSFILGF